MKLFLDNRCKAKVIINTMLKNTLETTTLMKNGTKLFNNNGKMVLKITSSTGNKLFNGYAYEYEPIEPHENLYRSFEKPIREVEEYILGNKEQNIPDDVVDKVLHNLNGKLSTPKGSLLESVDYGESVYMSKANDKLLNELEVLKIPPIPRKLMRQLKRTRARLLEVEKISNLTSHGFREIGYNQGRISTLENVLDEIYPEWEANE